MPLSEFIAASRIHFNQSAIDWTNVLFKSTVLPFTMQPQTQTNWCWAATATSVSHFYYSLSTWTQCKVAGAELGLSCCTTPVSMACNVPWYLDRALTRTNNYVSISGPITTSKVLDELKHGRVVGARIGWSGGGGHFMVIRGWGRVGPTEYFDIADPIYGNSHITVAEFTHNYQGSGHWTHAYFTKRWPTWRIRLPIFIDPDLLDLIRRARPMMLDVNRSPDDRTADIADTELAMPHEVYVVGLDELARGDDAMPGQLAAVRVVELQKGRFSAAYELTPPSEKQELRAMTDDAPTLQKLEQGLSLISRLADERKEDSDLRLVRVPALYVEAFVLQSGDEGDVAVVVRDGGHGLPEQMPAREFFDRLRGLARERLGGPQDDTIAP